MATNNPHTMNMIGSRIGFTPPPHQNAEVHRQVMDEIRAMTKEQFVKSTIEAGIYTPDGQLTAPYRSDDRNGMK